MYEGSRISIVIPAYNEVTRIEAVLREIPSWVDHIVVVDDASTDDTAERARAVIDPRIVVVRLEKNQGVGGATMAGFATARDLGAQLLVKMDGDGQMDPTLLPRLLDPLYHHLADFAKGNRFLHGLELGQMPWLRRVGNIGLSLLTKMASGYWTVFDPTNGYFALHAAVVQLLDQQRIHKRFFFESSLLLELGLHRAVVRDVYLPARYGTKVSHLSEGRALLEFPPLLVRGLLRRLWLQYFVRDFSAVSLLLLSGLSAAGFGFGWGVCHWLRSASTGLPASTGTVMVAVLPLMLGLQLLLQALVLDVENVPAEPIQPSRELTQTY